MAQDTAVVRLEITEQAIDGLRIGDFITLEGVTGGRVSLSDLRNLLARFVVDEGGKSVSIEDAKGLINDLTTKQFQGIIDQLSISLKGWKEKAVPPTTP